MKPDPYAHIKAALNRRVGTVIVKPLPLPLKQIVLVKRRRPVTVLSVKSLKPTQYVNHS